MISPMFFALRFEFLPHLFLFPIFLVLLLLFG